MSREFWQGKRVFLTGHTGFKGGWLALWLSDMGASVYGYALPPSTEPSFFIEVGLESRLVSSVVGDIRDGAALAEAMRLANPDVVFHLAAQPLVRYSYKDPTETYSVNVLGTVNLLEAVRKVPSIKAIVNITTDKCYENREWPWSYRENEAMGGHDPYSSSKACSELVTAAYRRSFLSSSGKFLASARAGNVIGGGDWAQDRLIPDFLRASEAARVLVVRNPLAVRPWQHVLEPLSGYLTLAESLFVNGERYAEPWNFGPEDADARSVQWIVEHLCSRVKGAAWRRDGSPGLHEAHTLKLDSSKAKSALAWRPRWSLLRALDTTLAWHESRRKHKNMAQVTLEQIYEYEATRV